MSVHHNTAGTFAGGVLVSEGSSFTLESGEIHHNSTDHSQGSGGGIFVDAGAHFTMTGGDVYENSSANGAGIIYTYPYDEQDVVERGSFEVLAGSIRGNQASDIGGGIYIGSEFATVNMGDVYVAENHATYGGGMYACPTGNTIVEVTNGAAFVDNTATEFGSMFFKATSSNLFYMQTRMLGGGRVHVYNDYPKYQPGDAELPPSGFQNVSGQLLFHTEVSADDAALAQQEAKIFVEDNGAFYGGGIANNGLMVLGTRDSSNQLTVTKEWKGDAPDVELDVQLVREGAQSVVLESFTLSEDNDWTQDFADLPGEFTYRVNEIAVDGYTATYENTTQGRHITITITNTPTSSPTEPPAPPETAVPPAEVHADPAVVNPLAVTGSNGMPGLVAAGLVALIAGLAITILARRRMASMR